METWGTLELHDKALSIQQWWQACQLYWLDHGTDAHHRDSKCHLHAKLPNRSPPGKLTKWSWDLWVSLEECTAFLYLCHLYLNLVVRIQECRACERYCRKSGHQFAQESFPHFAHQKSQSLWENQQVLVAVAKGAKFTHPNWCRIRP